MRLLFLTNFYPPADRGGYEQWCQEVAFRLHRRGHTVHVLTSRYGVHDSHPKEEHNVRRSLCLQSDLQYYSPSGFFVRRALQERNNEEELRNAILRVRPDVLMVWGLWNLSRRLPQLAEEWLPGKTAYYLGGYWPMEPDNHEQYWRAVESRPLSELVKKPLRQLALSILQREGYPYYLTMQHSMCCTNYVREVLVSAGKVPPTAGVIYGAIDPAPYLRIARAGIEGPGGPLRLLYYGSLSPSKGVHVAIEAVGQLRQQGLANDLQLTILGRGHVRYQAYLTELARGLDLMDVIQFVDWVPAEEIPSWLARNDVFLFTSVYPEPFGRTIVEAMAAGLTVIASDVGGSREILQYYYPELLFPPSDAEALARRVARVQGDPDLRNRLSALGRQLVVEHFTLDRMADEMEVWLTRIVQ